MPNAPHSWRATQSDCLESARLHEENDWGNRMSNFEFWHHHGGISVPDLDASITWYRNVLGFEVARRFPIPTIPADVAVLKNGPLHIELFQVAAARPLPAERREPDTDVYTHGNK